jgi:hypothetical protein
VPSRSLHTENHANQKSGGVALATLKSGRRPAFSIQPMICSRIIAMMRPDSATSAGIRGSRVGPWLSVGSKARAGTWANGSFRGQDGRKAENVATGQTCESGRRAPGTLEAQSVGALEGCEASPERAYCRL